MNYILPLIVGFLAAFIGLLAPSMLNMTAARTSIEKGKKAGIQFAAGAASVVFIQAFIAVYFANKITPEIIKTLQKAAIFVLLALSVFFFIQAREKFKAEGKNKKGNIFVIGMGMSSLNMLAVPFYLAMAKVGEGYGMLLEIPYSIVYVVGAVLGAFTLFTIYATFAEKIAEKAQFIAKNINYILSVLFVVLALLTAYQVYLK